MKKGKCPHCGKQDCYEHCYANNSGKHEVIQMNNVATYIVDEGAIIVDFACRRCGQSGSARLKSSDVQWTEI